MEMTRIGTVHKPKTDEAGEGCATGRDSCYIDIEEQYAGGLLGIDGFSHVIVCYWFDRNDSPESRSTLRVYPRADENNPLTGVFATHSPLRPNPIALTICRLLRVEGCRLYLENIDALDGSPVVDIKCYIDWAMPQERVRLPDWV
jgi:tRNA (adenine37-N6)-methyltransferase